MQIPTNLVKLRGQLGQHTRWGNEEQVRELRHALALGLARRDLLKQLDGIELAMDEATQLWQIIVEHTETYQTRMADAHEDAGEAVSA